MTRLVLILASLAMFAGHIAAKGKPQPQTGAWFARSVTSKSPGTVVTQSTGDIATCAFPIVPLGAGPLAFIVTTSVSPLIGNHQGQTMSASFSLTGPATFTYWGFGTSANSCTGHPASVRLFFSTRTDFSTAYGDEVWYSNPVHIDLSQGTWAMADSLADPSQWSNGQGKVGNDPSHIAAFQAATASIAQTGLAFGGGCFFDVGVGVSSGSSTIHITSLGFQ